MEAGLQSGRKRSTVSNHAKVMSVQIISPTNKVRTTFDPTPIGKTPRNASHAMWANSPTGSFRNQVVLSGILFGLYVTIMKLWTIEFR